MKLDRFEVSWHIVFGFFVGVCQLGIWLRLSVLLEELIRIWEHRRNAVH